MKTGRVKSAANVCNIGESVEISENPEAIDEQHIRGGSIARVNAIHS